EEEGRDHRTTKPLRTTNPSSSPAARGGQSSPGELSAGLSEVDLESTNQGSAAPGDLTQEPISMLTSDLQRHLSLTPPSAGETHTDTHTQHYTLQ
ncbi:hypothetical protein JOQ06_009981, partial [Pogonophryne albipinna]